MELTLTRALFLKKKPLCSWTVANELVNIKHEKNPETAGKKYTYTKSKKDTYTKGPFSVCVVFTHIITVFAKLCIPLSPFYSYYKR